MHEAGGQAEGRRRLGTGTFSQDHSPLKGRQRPRVGRDRPPHRTLFRKRELCKCQGEAGFSPGNQHSPSRWEMHATCWGRCAGGSGQVHTHPRRPLELDAVRLHAFTLLDQTGRPSIFSCLLPAPFRGEALASSCRVRQDLNPLLSVTSLYLPFSRLSCAKELPWPALPVARGPERAHTHVAASAWSTLASGNSVRLTSADL